MKDYILKYMFNNAFHKHTFHKNIIIKYIIFNYIIVYYFISIDIWPDKYKKLNIKGSNSFSANFRKYQ